jgi:hypothetical protein
MTKDADLSITAIIVAYQYAIIMAYANRIRKCDAMNYLNGESARRSRASEYAIVTDAAPEAPLRGRSTAKANRVSASIGRDSVRSRRSDRRDTEFRFFLDRDGRQHFNFKQQIWLDSSVPMAYTRVYSTALKTLAVNLLTLVTDKRNCRIAIGLTSRKVLLLAPSFSRQCLLGAPDTAWALPRSTIESWLEAQARRRRPKNRHSKF